MVSNEAKSFKEELAIAKAAAEAQVSEASANAAGEAQVHELRAKVEILRQEVEAGRQSNEQLGKDLETARGQSRNLEAKVEDMQVEHGKALTDKQSRIDTLECKAAAAAEVSQPPANNSQVEEELRSQLDEATLEVESLSTKLAKAAASIAALEASKREAASMAPEEAQQEVEQLRQKLAAAEKSEHDIRKSLEESQAKIEKLQKSKGGCCAGMLG